MISFLILVKNSLFYRADLFYFKAFPYYFFLRQKEIGRFVFTAFGKRNALFSGFLFRLAFLWLSFCLLTEQESLRFFRTHVLLLVILRRKQGLRSLFLPAGCLVYDALRSDFCRVLSALLPKPFRSSAVTFPHV